MQITFRSKVVEMGYTDGTKWHKINVPTIKFHHVDRESALKESKWSGYVNSTLFLPKINREIRNQFGSDYPIIDLRSVPDNVTIDTSGFLAEVTITI